MKLIGYFCAISFSLFTVSTARRTQRLLQDEATEPDPVEPEVEDLNRANFLAYTAQFGKQYESTAEFESRFANWLLVDSTLLAVKDSGVTFTHNRFSDRSP